MKPLLLFERRGLKPFISEQAHRSVPSAYGDHHALGRENTMRAVETRSPTVVSGLTIVAPTDPSGANCVCCAGFDGHNECNAETSTNTEDNDYEGTFVPALESQPSWTEIGESTAQFEPDRAFPSGMPAFAKHEAAIATHELDSAASAGHVARRGKLVPHPAVASDSNPGEIAQRTLVRALARARETLVPRVPVMKQSTASHASGLAETESGGAFEVHAAVLRSGKVVLMTRDQNDHGQLASYNHFVFDPATDALRAASSIRHILHDSKTGFETATPPSFAELARLIVAVTTLIIPKTPASGFLVPSAVTRGLGMPPEWTRPPSVTWKQGFSLYANPNFIKPPIPLSVLSRRGCQQRASEWTSVWSHGRNPLRSPRMPRQ